MIIINILYNKYINNIVITIIKGYLDRNKEWNEWTNEENKIQKWVCKMKRVYYW